MPQPPRIEFPGACHHVWGRGNKQQQVFFTAHDNARFLALLAAGVRKRGWRCLGYCLMVNHFHLVLKTPEPNLGDGMRDLLGTYSRRHPPFPGDHLWKNRFGSKPILSDNQMLATLRYVARNPVSAGMVDEPGDWQWSSHAAVVSGRPSELLAVDDVLAFWNGDSAAYAAFVDGQLDDRPSLDDIERTHGDDGIAIAVTRYGFAINEVARHFGVHRSTAARRVDAAKGV